MPRPCRPAAVLLALALFVTAGCTSADDEPVRSAAGGDSGSTVRVGYATASRVAGRDAFVYVAKEKGYYREAGLEVGIRSGDGTAGNLSLLKEDEVQFAALDLTGAVIQAGTGRFPDWRAVAAVHQRTLACVLTTAGTGIAGPADLSGRTIATGSGSVGELLFPAYARAAGLDPAAVTVQRAKPGELTGLMSQRRVDALGTVVLSGAELAGASGKDVVVLPYSDYLGDLFGDAIVTTPKLIGEDRDLVQRFVTASLRGLRHTLEHPREAAQILHRSEPDAQVAAATAEITAMKAYVAPPGSAPIGHLDERRVARTVAAIQGAGQMPAGLTPDRIADFGFVAQAAG